ncbi:MAG TPA: 3-dehydroquinate synthase family protein [Gammaproteobacteria bacterium]|nr:3-dehydroquinate synthase family protein [Gammaproteobacteria bacterium]
MEPYSFIPHFNDSRLIEALTQHHHIAIVCDHKVASLYGYTLQQHLQDHVKVSLILHDQGEHAKTRETKANIEDQLALLKIKKKDAIVALGGGMTLDLAGFTAATYLRGLATYYIPTTLLACVDACLGGKVAINTSFGKNTIGTFHSAKAIFIPTFTFKTLDKKEMINGYMEAIKTHALHLPPPKPNCPPWSKSSYKEIISDCLKIKRYFVSKDPFDQNHRKLLNFGHTLGHALEKASNHTLDHGMAVGYGMILEAFILHQLELCDKQLPSLLRSITTYYQLPVNTSLPSAEQLLKYCLYDKKNSEDIELVCLPSWGQPHPNKITQPIPQDKFLDLLQQALENLKDSHVSCNNSF